MQTYWQTETGSHVITPLGGVTPTKPGSASLPFFGIEPAIIDPVSGEEVHGNDVEGVLAIKKPWPSMARTVWGAHKRYMDTYLNVYKGYYVSRLLRIQLLFPAKMCLSLLVMELAETMRDTTGSVVVSMTLSMFLGTGCRPRKLKQHSLNTVSQRCSVSGRLANSR